MNAELEAHLRRKAEEAGEGSTLCKALRNAAKSVRAHTALIGCADDAKGIKGVGPYIFKEIVRFFSELAPAAASSSIAPAATATAAPDSSVLATAPAVLAGSSAAPASAPVPKKSRARKRDAETTAETTEPLPKSRRSQSYIPRVGSGAHAILVAMHEAASDPEYKGFLLKAELIEKAQPYCDQPFVYNGPARPDNISERITAWSAMNKTLIKKSLVVSFSKPSKYMLTPDGERLAAECSVVQANLRTASARVGADVSKSTQSSSVHVSSKSGDACIQHNKKDTIMESQWSHSSSGATVDVDASHLLQGIDPTTTMLLLFDVVLLLDHRERLEGDRQAISQMLHEIDVKHEMRELRCGDVMWIAQSKAGVFPAKAEFVLDDLAERKTVQDLLTSIKDDRYPRQRHMLKMCRVPRILYIIEGDINSAEEVDAAESAIETMRISDGFLVHETENVAATVRLYASLTKSIQDTLRHQKLREFMSSGPRLHEQRMMYREYQTFLEELDVTTVQRIFSRQLRQVHGCGSRRAEYLASLHPTLESLLSFYSGLPPEARPGALTQLKAPGASTRFPASLSRDIYECLC